MSTERKRACTATSSGRQPRWSLAVLIIAGVCAGATQASAQFSGARSAPGEAGDPYPRMPSIAPIGVRIDKYLDVPASARGPAIDPAKGYRLQELGRGLYMICLLYTSPSPRDRQKSRM